MRIKYEYCPICKTISKVIMTVKGKPISYPKECRCKAGADWVPDEELKKVLEDEDNGI